MAKKSSKELAINDGPKAVQTDPGGIFGWPIITREDEEAVLEVIRAGKMSGGDVTQQLEQEYAEWHGMKYALGHNTGTAALQAAMFGCKLGAKDELICQSMTYWASCLQAFSLGATIVFAEMDPMTLTLDPEDVKKKITKHTKAIMAVHYCGYPTDMDPIMKIAKEHDIKVIEDVSHAHGGLYKGRLVGTMGHVAAMSVMSGKSLACGEGGMLMTNNKEIYERAIAYGHYERTGGLTIPYLAKYRGLPQGGQKFRMHQASSAVLRVQLRHYHDRMAVIQKAMNEFWDHLEGVPGIRAHRPAKESGSTMGGWYAAHGLYVPEELDNLPIQKFCEAVRAEGVGTSPGANMLLHLHPLLSECDIYGHGKPTRLAMAKRKILQPKGSLPVTESLPERCYGIPWFKHYDPKIIAEHALAFRKVCENADQLK